MAGTQDDRIGGLASSTAIKAPVMAATTANISLSTGGLLSIDGYQTVAGDRVLVMNQTTGSQNGIYVASTGAWSYDQDSDGNRDWTQGSIVYVVNGTANGNKFFQLTAANPITVGTTNMTFSAVTVAFQTPAANSIATSMLQANAVTYAKLQQASAGNVVLGNATAAAANFAEIAVAQSTMLGRGATGNIANITVGSGLSMSGTTLSATPSVLRSYLAGLTMSTAGSSATMTIAAGQATDSTNASSMTLSASIAKTTSAWTAGSTNGGLDTSAIANSTWYHFFLIAKADLSAVDVLFSLSPSSPTMPANYTLKRRIGSGKTDGSANWTSFVQFGDEFLWASDVLDVNNAATVTTAALLTLTVPTGVQVWAMFRARATSTANTSFIFTSPDQSDQAPSVTAAPLSSLIDNTAYTSAPTLIVRTNTSAQVRHRESANTDTFYLSTFGWIDRRGKDS